jgi:lipid A ethanolaminephosphotransferase
MPFKLSVGALRTFRPTLTPVQLSGCLALVLALFYNGPLWRLILSLDDADPLHRWLFAGAFLLFMVAVFQIVLSLVSWPRLIKPLALFLLISAALANYFMDSYGILFDRTMVQNLFETDSAEVADLLTFGLFWQLLLKGVMPSLLVLWVQVKPQPVMRLLAAQGVSLLGCMLLIGGNAALLYKDYSSLFRNHREIRNLAVPSSYLYYSARYLAGAYDTASRPFQPLGLDAVRVEAPLRSVGGPSAKPDLLVLVLGETARSMNFGVNGYARETTPELAQLPVVSFSNVTACGTSTAVSVPCMFSLLTHDQYDEEVAANQSNVLDVLQQAGIDVRWSENNSGCKGVCNRIPVIDVRELGQGSACTAHECFDDQLLTALRQQLAELDRSAVIVLHQQGSHGPAYYKRVPPPFEHFTPVCRSSELQSCSRESIVNAYDNTLRYTDHLLARVVETLRADERFNTAMLYVSDHGESLGENNLYLHGMPWLLAPPEQKTVPMIAWLSPRFQQRHGIDAGCLQAHRDVPLSHDNLPHSLLGLMNVSTSVYDADLDLFADCRQNAGQLAGLPAQSAANRGG